MSHTKFFLSLDYVYFFFTADDTSHHSSVVTVLQEYYFRVCIMIKQKVPKPGRGSEEQGRVLSSRSRFVTKSMKNAENTYDILDIPQHKLLLNFVDVFVSIINCY